MTALKQKVAAMAVVLLIVLAVFTFVSRSIYNYNLPRVTAYKVDQGTITLTADAVGKLDYEGANDLKAHGMWIIDDVKVRDGQQVYEGDVLCTFDTLVSDINIQTLKLNVLKAQNALEQYRQDMNVSSQETTFDDYVYKQAITNAKMALTRKQAELADAQATLADVRQSELPTSVVLTVQRRQQDLLEAEGVLTKMQAVLKKAQDDKKDSSAIQVAQIAVDEAQKTVMLAQQALQDAKVSEQNAEDMLSSNAKTAQKAVTLAQQAVEDAQASLDTANSNLVHAQDAFNKNLNLMPEPNRLAEATATLSIAQAQLELAVSQMPPSSGLVAPCDGVVFGMWLKTGETAQPHDTIVTVIPDNAKPRLTFILPSDAGATYGPKSNVKATLETSDINQNGTHIRETVNGMIVSGILNKDGWTCEATLNDMKGQPVAGQDVLLEVSAKFGDGEFVIPIGGLFDDGNGGKCVFTIDMRPGLFGQESYVAQQTVEVVVDNGKYALVTGSITSRQTIASTPSRPISTGTAVWVKEK